MCSATPRRIEGRAGSIWAHSDSRLRKRYIAVRPAVRRAHVGTVAIWLHSWSSVRRTTPYLVRGDRYNGVEKEINCTRNQFHLPTYTGVLSCRAPLPPSRWQNAPAAQHAPAAQQLWGARIRYWLPPPVRPTVKLQFCNCRTMEELQMLGKAESSPEIGPQLQPCPPRT